MVAGRSSESMTHDPQISIPCGQCEGRSKMIRLPHSKSSITTAREQYHSGTAHNNGRLAGSESRAVRSQFGLGIRIGFGENRDGPDGNQTRKTSTPIMPTQATLFLLSGTDKGTRHTFSGHVRPQRYQLSSLQVTPSYPRNNSWLLHPGSSLEVSRHWWKCEDKGPF
jgi:hypothetical protein